MKFNLKKLLVLFIMLNSFALESLAQMDDLTSSVELGLTVSGYKYKEPNVIYLGVLRSNFCTLAASHGELKARASSPR